MIDHITKRKRKKFDRKENEEKGKDSLKNVRDPFRYSLSTVNLKRDDEEFLSLDFDIQFRFVPTKKQKTKFFKMKNIRRVLLRLSYRYEPMPQEEDHRPHGRSSSLKPSECFGFYFCFKNEISNCSVLFRLSVDVVLDVTRVVLFLSLSSLCRFCLLNRSTNDDRCFSRCRQMKSFVFYFFN